MDTGHPLEPEHRGTGPRRNREGYPKLKLVHSSDRKTAAPAVEFGSGWYHDAAIMHAHDIDSHRAI